MLEDIKFTDEQKEQSVQILNVNTRLRTYFSNENIKTIGEILKVTDVEFMRSPDVGKIALSMLKAELMKVAEPNPSLELPADIDQAIERQKQIVADAQARLAQLEWANGQGKRLEDGICNLLRKAGVEVAQPVQNKVVELIKFSVSHVKLDTLNMK